jgi:putative DNA primase/helicase
MTVPPDAQRFLSVLFSDGSLTDDVQVNLRGLIHQAPRDTATQHFVSASVLLGDDDAALLTHWNAEQQRSVYLAPGLRRGQIGTKLGVAAVTALWVDLDAKAIVKTDPPLTVEQRHEGKRLVRKVLTDRLPATLQPSLMVDTGGGLQAWWRLKEPAWVGEADDAYAVQTLERYLKGLARHLEADPMVAQLAALMRLPGYVNRKYPDAPMAAIIEDHPERQFNLSDFDEYVLVRPSTAPSLSTSPRSGSNGRRRIESLGQLAAVLETCSFLQWCRDHPAEVREPLWYAMCSNLVRLEGGREAAHAFSQTHPGYSVRETDDKLDHAREASGPISCAKIQELGFTGCPPTGHGVTSPAGLGRPRATTTSAADAPDDGHETVGGRRIDEAAASTPLLVTLSDVVAEPIHWAWPGRLAFGKITLFIGDPGVGKSYLLMDMAAHVTTGRPWPNGLEAAPVGDVIVLSAEDGLADTIRPRVDRQRGDPRRVHVLEAVADARAGRRSFQLGRDLPALEAALRTTGASYASIDPLSAYLGTTDSHKDAEVRGLLAPLADLAETYRVAIAAVLHLTKDAARRLIARASGSMAFAAAARIVLAVGTDPDDETKERIFLVPVKNNLGRKAPGLAFRISDAGLCWEAHALPSTISAENLLDSAALPASREDAVQRHEAEDFLRRLLDTGPVPSTQIFKDAKANGVAERTLWRAKRTLGIAAERIPPGPRGAWFWSLP